MTYVLIASQPNGTLQDVHGEARSPTVEFRQANGTAPDHYDGTLVSHYADNAGTGGLTTPITPDSRGRLMRYIVAGSYRQIVDPSNVLNLRESIEFHASPGTLETSITGKADLTRLGRVSGRYYGMTGLGVVSETAAFQLAADGALADNKTLEIERGTYLLDSAESTATLNSTTTITSVSPTTGWVNGMPISGLGIPDSTTVVSGAGTATMVLSNAATATASGAAIYGGVCLRPGSRVVAHPEALFKETGAGQTIRLYSPTARTPRTTYPLTVDGVLGAFTITVSAANSLNFTAGDMVNIRDTTTLGSVANHRESNIVESVNTGTGVITFKFPLTFAYLIASAAFVAKVTPAQNIHWWGGRFDLTGKVSGSNDRDVIYSDWALDCTVSQVRATAWVNKVVAFHGGIDCHMDHVYGYSPTSVGPGQGYVGQFENSRHCSMNTMWGRNARHVGDEVSGSDNLINGVYAVGRTTDSTTAVLLHGLESRRCRVTNVFAANLDFGFQAGNGTFGADYDFEADGMVFHGCTDGVLIAQGCSNFKVTARATSSVVRAGTVDSCTNGELNIAYDGITTNPSNYGAVMCAGTSDGIILRVRGRNPIYKGMLISASGAVDVLDSDIDMSTVAQNGIDATGLSATSVVRVRGGRVKMNNNTGTVTGVSLNGPAGATLSVDNMLVTGTMVRGVYFAGAATDAEVGGVLFRGTIGEQIRAEAGVVRVGGGTDFTSGTGIRLATAAAQLFLSDVDLSAATTKISNTVAVASTATTTASSTSLTLVSPTTSWANGMTVSGTGIPPGAYVVSGAGTATMVMSVAATASAAGVAITGTASVLGADALRAPTGVQSIGVDAAFTLTPGTSPGRTFFTPVMAANRAVTLSTTGAFRDMRWKITRTATATGAFTLDIGTGPLKSLAVSQWCVVEYDGSAWKLAEFGSL